MFVKAHTSTREIDLSKFHVVTMISNHAYGRLGHEYKSRYRLYEAFRARLERAGIKLWTIELAFGARPHVVTQPDDIHDLQFRTGTELWHKERALKLMKEHLTECHPDWQALAWIDADVEFPNWDGEHAWYRETCKALHHFNVVQLFQTAIDLGPDGQALHTHTGFGFAYRKQLPFKSGYQNWHPGFAWAARRETLEATDFIDFGILGSGDRHMACGWVGKILDSVSSEVSPQYIRRLTEWQDQAERYVRRNLGFVPGTILHHWHGRKKDRRYQDRWKILVDTQFDPERDIKTDCYGLYQWADHGDVRSIELRDKVRDYFTMRNEDSIDLE